MAPNNGRNSVPSAVPPSINPGNAVGSAIETVEELVEDVLSVGDFQPRPGGMIDEHRKAKARREEAAREREDAAEPIEEHSYQAVKVAQIQPETVAINIITIPAGGNAAILPMSPYRARADITVVTAASTVLLAKDTNQATGLIGFPITTGQIKTVLARAQVYASNPGGSAVQVAVFVELEAPPK